MDPINGVNSQNYAISTPQQNNQIQNDYSSMPMVYEPEMEEKKKASSSMLGMTALGLLAIGGVGYGIYKNKKVDGLKQQITQLSAEKEALGKAKDEITKAKEEVTKALDKERTLSTWERFKRLFKPTSGLTEEEVKARNAAKEAKKKAAQEVKDAEKSKKSGNSNNAENKAEVSGTENTANKTEESK